MAGAGEIALNPDEDVTTQRKHNRRVDIYFTPFSPQNFEEFYDYFSNRNTQEFKVNGAAESTIFGKEGTMIIIPNDVLCLKDGTPVGDQEVIIELREAYSYQDIFLENLNTHSDGDFIETDGMFYIAAQTTDGQEVFIQDGKKLDIFMPSNRPNADGMEVFYGDQSATTSTAPTQWAARNVQFKRRNFSLRILSNFCMDVNVDSSYMSPMDSVSMPDFITKYPVKPNKPAVPQMRMKRPTMETTAQRYKKRKKEKETTYQERLVELYKRDSSIYALNYNDYLRDMEEYRRDSTTYEGNMVEYHTDVDAYEQNHEEFLAWLETEKDYISEWLFSFNIYTPNQSTCLQRMPYQIYTLEWYSKYLIEYGEQYKIDVDSIKMIYTPEVIDALDSMDLVTRRLYYFRGLSNNYQQRRSAYRGIDAIWQFLGADENVLISHAQMDEVYTMYPDTATVLYEAIRQLNKRAAYLDRLVDSYNKVIEEGEFQKYMTIVLRYQEDLNGYIEPIRSVEERNRELGREYMNAANISQFGWVNCDRFLNIPRSEKQHLVVYSDNVGDEDDGSIKYVAFCQDTKVVTELLPRTDGSFITSYSGLPKNEQVTLIGLEIEDGKSEYVQNRRQSK